MKHNQKVWNAIRKHFMNTHHVKPIVRFAKQQTTLSRVLIKLGIFGFELNV